jgi:uncharacterized protein YqjF (DUF2071 family)
VARDRRVAAAVVRIVLGSPPPRYLVGVTSALDAPRARLTDVSSTLRDVVITTYDVAPEVLASFLPKGLTVERFVMPDGRERAMVSAVSFFNTRFYVHFAPFVKLACGQTNYRAYVRRGEERAVWFFGTSLDSPFVLLPRHAWRLPWHRMHVERESAWSGERLESLRWHARAEGAEEKLVLRGTGEPLGVLPGFSSEEDTHRVLTHPLVGYLRRRDGRLVTYGVWHAHLEMERAQVEDARFERFEALGLVSRGQAPSSVLVQRTTQFLVLLPPRRCDHLEAAPQ